MKHAIEILRDVADQARITELAKRQEGDAKAARQAKAVAWDCLNALHELKLVLAARKLAGKRKEVEP